MRPIRLMLASVMAGTVASLIVTDLLPVVASMGVGVELAEIKIDEDLRPGEVYQLPAVEVLNTGDQAGSYEATIALNSDQTELLAYADWFRFEPQSFDLEPGASARVAVSMHLPVDAQGGDYTVLIEVHTLSGGGETTAIGDAAATKLNFSVKRADSGFVQRGVLHLCVALGLVAAVMLAWLIRRLFPFRLRLERR